jgi:hypothetical protein
MAYTPTSLPIPRATDLADAVKAFTDVSTAGDTNFGAIQTELGKWDPLLTGAAFNLMLGNPAANTDYSYVVQRLYAPDLWALKFHIGDNSNQRIALIELTKGGVEQAQLFYRTDGQLLMKTSGPSGVSRPVPWAMWSGSVAIPVAGVSYGQITVNSSLQSPSTPWPVGRFTVTPIVTVTSTASIWMCGLAAGWTKDGGPVYARSYNNSNGAAGASVACMITAIQMTPSSASG